MLPILTVLGAGGIGGIAVRVWDAWLKHAQVKRKQTDGVAIDLVQRLTERLDLVEQARADDRRAWQAREELCEAQLEVVRHELRNVESAFDGLLLALKYADPAQTSAIIAEVAQSREKRRENATGQNRNDAQVAISTAALMRDSMEPAL